VAFGLSEGMIEDPPPNKSLDRSEKNCGMRISNCGFEIAGRVNSEVGLRSCRNPDESGRDRIINSAWLKPLNVFFAG